MCPTILSKVSAKLRKLGIPQDLHNDKVSKPIGMYSTINRSGSSRNKNCMYCLSSEHYSQQCPIEGSAPKRINWWQNNHEGTNPCKLCMRHNEDQGECNQKAKCNQLRCNESKPHARDLCPLNFKSETVIFCPDLVRENVNSLGSKSQRAIALSTATFNCLNLK